MNEAEQLLGKAEILKNEAEKKRIEANLKKTQIEKEKSEIENEKAEIELKLHQIEMERNKLFKENEKLKEKLNEEWLQANYSPPETPTPMPSITKKPQERMRDVTILKTSDKTSLVFELKRFLWRFENRSEKFKQCVQRGSTLILFEVDQSKNLIRKNLKLTIMYTFFLDLDFLSPIYLHCQTYDLIIRHYIRI